MFTLGYYNGNWTVRAIQICLSFCGMRAVWFWFVQSARREVTFSSFFLSFFFFSLLQVLHEFVFGIQRMFEFHPSLRLRQAKCLPAACYYNLRDMVRISICICLEFRFFVRKKTFWVFAEVARLFFLAYAISFFIGIRRLALEYFYFKVDIIGYRKINLRNFCLLTPSETHNNNNNNIKWKTALQENCVLCVICPILTNLHFAFIWVLVGFDDPCELRSHLVCGL